MRRIGGSQPGAYERLFDAHHWSQPLHSGDRKVAIAAPEAAVASYPLDLHLRRQANRFTDRSDREIHHPSLCDRRDIEIEIADVQSRIAIVLRRRCHAVPTSLTAMLSIAVPTSLTALT